MRDVVRRGVLVGLLAPAGVLGQPADPTPATFHRGVTFEANVGIGLIYSKEGNRSDSGAGLGGLDLGVGGWLDEHHALTLRFTGVTFSPESDRRFTDGFLGPSLQYWLDDKLWLGGGVGLGLVGVSGDGPTITGLALDLRAGYTVASSSEHTFNLSVELDPGWYSINTGDDAGSSRSATYVAAALLVGYQFL